MLNIEVRHSFEISQDAFWEQIFFNDAFNRNLYVNILGYHEYKQVHLSKEDSGVIRRTLKLQPAITLPSIAKKVLGDSLTYTEEGCFDPATQRWSYKIVPSVRADQIHVAGEFWVEPKSTHEVERICTAHIQVDLFVVGGMLETILENELRQGYDKAAAYTRSYLQRVAKA